MDQSDVRVETVSYNAKVLYDGYYKENILHNPIEKTSIDYTRDIEKMSRVIEALILDIPFGNFVISTTGYYNMIVVNKQFELYSLFKFFENDFKLEGLKVRSDLNGMKYDDLQGLTRRRVGAALLFGYEIPSEVPDDVRSYLIEYLKTL